MRPWDYQNKQIVTVFRQGSVMGVNKGTEQKPTAHEDLPRQNFLGPNTNSKLDQVSSPCSYLTIAMPLQPSQSVFAVKRFSHRDCQTDVLPSTCCVVPH